MLCFTKLSNIGKAGLNESFKNPQRLLKAISGQALIRICL